MVIFPLKSNKSTKLIPSFESPRISIVLRFPLIRLYGSQQKCAKLIYIVLIPFHNDLLKSHITSLARKSVSTFMTQFVNREWWRWGAGLRKSQNQVHFSFCRSRMWTLIDVRYTICTSRDVSKISQDRRIGHAILRVLILDGRASFWLVNTWSSPPKWLFEYIIYFFSPQVWRQEIFRKIPKQIKMAT